MISAKGALQFRVDLIHGDRGEKAETAKVDREQDIMQRHKQLLRYEFNQPRKRPVVNGNEIHFNGQGEDGHETPIALISRSEYMAINDKISEGPVNSVYYDRQLTNGQLRELFTAEAHICELS